MTEQIQHTDSAAPFTILVTFEWGNSHVARYCRWTEDITIGADTFTAVPQLSARLQKSMEGGTAPEEVEITLPIIWPPLVTIVQPYKHAAVKVTIEEFSPGTDASRRILFYGKAGTVKVSPKGSSSIARMQVLGIKSRLEVIRLGIQANSACIHTFGDSLCGFNIEAAKLVFVPTVFSVSAEPNKVSGTISGSPDMDNSRWARGFLRFDGVSITIRSVAAEGTNPNPTVTLNLREPPPVSWQGQSVELYPGCNKTIQACRDPFRDRESQFLGTGIAMLGYDPTRSDSPSG